MAAASSTRQQTSAPVEATLGNAQIRATPLSSEDEKRAALFQKLLGVMSIVQNVPKNGNNTFHKYKYATESDIKAAVQQALVQYRLVFMPISQEIVSREEPVQSKKEQLTRTRLTYKWVDPDSGYSEVATIDGFGSDQGDKGVWKGYTGAIKYALSGTLLFSSGDLDPEYDQREPEQYSRNQQQGNGYRDQPRQQQPQAQPQPAPQPAKPRVEPKPQPNHPAPLADLLSKAMKEPRQAISEVIPNLYADLAELIGTDAAKAEWDKALSAIGKADIKDVSTLGHLRSLIVALWSADPNHKDGVQK